VSWGELELLIIILKGIALMMVQTEVPWQAGLQAAQHPSH
jgi:hypothetical protein